MAGSSRKAPVRLWKMTLRFWKLISDAEFMEYSDLRKSRWTTQSSDLRQGFASGGANGSHILPSPIRDRPRFSGIYGFLADQIATRTHEFYSGFEVIRERYKCFRGVRIFMLAGRTL